MKHRAERSSEPVLLKTDKTLLATMVEPDKSALQQWRKAEEGIKLIFKRFKHADPAMECLGVDSLKVEHRWEYQQQNDGSFKEVRVIVDNRQPMTANHLEKLSEAIYYKSIGLFSRMASRHTHFNQWHEEVEDEAFLTYYKYRMLGYGIGISRAKAKEQAFNSAMDVTENTKQWHATRRYNQLQIKKLLATHTEDEILEMIENGEYFKRQFTPRKWLDFDENEYMAPTLVHFAIVQEWTTNRAKHKKPDINKVIERIFKLASDEMDTDIISCMLEGMSQTDIAETTGNHRWYIQRRIKSIGKRYFTHYEA